MSNRSCVVSFEGNEVVELKSGRDQCAKDFDNDGSLEEEHEVCVENFRGDDVFACNIKIEEMHEELEGEEGH